MAHTFFESFVGYYYWAVGWWMMISAVCLSLGVIITLGKLGWPNEVYLSESWATILKIIFAAAVFFGAIGIWWGLFVSVPVAIGKAVLGG